MANAPVATGPPTEGLLADAGVLLPDMIELRRRIHRHPELGLDLPGTQKAVLDALDGLGMNLHLGKATTSVIGVMDGPSTGPVTLLRADMDALPMDEETDLPFSSEVGGAMHACGHDAHVAMLVGAARLITRRRTGLGGRVVLAFQPGEEGYGGAKVMIGEGMLTAYGAVQRAFALHITPVLGTGWLACRRGPLMASADEFRITVIGRGGHASMPQDAVDPVPVACEIVSALQTMVTRRVPAFDPAVVTVGRISTGSTWNVVPERAQIEGTARAVSEGSRKIVLDGIRRVAELVAAAHLCRAEVEMIGEGYPVTINHGEAVEELMGIARRVVGNERVVEMPTPTMASEDWSYVLQNVAGCMAFLGAAPPGIDQPEPNHSNRMVINERAMAIGAAIYAALALSTDNRAGQSAPEDD